MVCQWYGISWMIVLLCSVAAGAQTSNVDESLFADFEEEKASPLTIKGFLDGRVGPRLVRPVENRTYTLAEVRAQLEIRYQLKNTELAAVTDVKYSPLQSKPFGNIEQGAGLLDIRELSVSQPIGSDFTIVAGRQVLTWGTGDMLFINDLFPKDWKSLFVGRQVQYLKAPSNSVKLSNYNRLFTLDVVWTPRFTPDRFVNGRNLEYYSPPSQKIVGRSEIIDPSSRDDYIEDSEIAVRLHKLVGGVELDVYGYKGYWKTPEGFNEQNQYFFPKLTTIGASVRAPWLAGIVNLEWGHYFSPKASKYSQRIIRNSEDRLLLGYEKEIVKNLTGSTQLYLEYLNDYKDYLQYFDRFAFRDELKTLVTLRIRYATLQQRLNFSLFGYFSPTENDGYIKSLISYKRSDNLQYQLGANFFSGTDDFTFFGQFRTNSNLFGGITWYF